MSDEKSKKVFVGPSDSSWLKFKVAGIAWRMTKGNSIPYIGYIPGSSRLAMWAFEVRVMSRDFEVTDE